MTNRFSLLRLTPTLCLFAIVHDTEGSPMSTFQFAGSTSQLRSYPSVLGSVRGCCKGFPVSMRFEVHDEVNRITICPI